MLLKWIVYILLAAAAAITVWMAIIGRPEPKRRRIWIPGIATALLAFFAVLLQFPSDELGKMRCSIDSLTAAILEKDTELAKELAECVLASGVILLTAMDSGLVAIGLGDYEKAITHLNYVVLAAQDDSSKAEAYFYRGFAYHSWGDSLAAAGAHDGAAARYEQAIVSNDSALVHVNDHPGVWHNRALALGNLGRYEEEIASYDSALAYKHDKVKVWYNRGVALWVLSRYHEALACCDSALKYDLNPTKAIELRNAILKEMKEQPQRH